MDKFTKMMFELGVAESSTKSENVRKIAVKEAEKATNDLIRECIIEYHNFLCKHSPETKSTRELGGEFLKTLGIDPVKWIGQEIHEAFKKEYEKLTK